MYGCLVGSLKIVMIYHLAKEEGLNRERAGGTSDLIREGWVIGLLRRK